MGTQQNPTDLLAQQVRETQELKALVQQALDRMDNVESVRVKIIDQDVPFSRLVEMLIKIGLAAIPAGIVLTILFWAVLALIGALLGGWG